MLNVMCSLHLVRMNLHHDQVQLGGAGIEPGFNGGGVMACVLVARLAPYVHSLRNGKCAVGDRQQLRSHFWGTLAIVMRVRRGPTAVVEDERDRVIAAQAEKWARGGLTFCLIGLWIMLWFSPDRRLQWATPKMLACVIFFILLSVSLARNAVAATMYRRDRR